MNTKNIVIFIAGATVGAVVSYFVTKKHCEAVVQEEIDNIVKEYEDLSESVGVKGDEMMEHFYNRMDRKFSPDGPTSKNEDQKTQYSKIIHSTSYTEEEESEHISEISDDDEEEPTFPHVISEEEFFENASKYDQETLTYYSDGTLAEENDEIIPDIDGTISLESLEEFNVEGNTGTIYVRNPKTEIDYEINYHDDSYAHYVLGVDDE